jgi:hypothetical protein
MTIDLGVSQGREIFLRLVEDADAPSLSDAAPM